MDRKVAVYLYENLVGTLNQTGDHYSFQYLSGYNGAPISINLPVREKPYESDKLHPVFLSLAPEGWLRKTYAETQKIDEKDTLGLLLNNGNDLIGAIQLKRTAK